MCILVLVDIDECHESDGYLNDCSPKAWCINTYGSYMCSCYYEYQDVSLDPTSRPGRACEGRFSRM